MRGAKHPSLTFNLPHVVERKLLETVVQGEPKRGKKRTPQGFLKAPGKKG